MSPIHEVPVDTEIAPASPNFRTHIGGVALREVVQAAQHFYQADAVAPSIPIAIDGDHTVHAVYHDNTRQNETIGVGPDRHEAIEDTLARMRSLEKITTKSLASIEMAHGQKVHFTSLEHYAPRIAPGAEAYPIPAHLEKLTAGHTFKGENTYGNTVKQDGWQQEIRTAMDDYIENDPWGAALAKQLKISTLQHLTPEQAVKFSSAFVQDVSKYDWSHVGSRGRADASTTMELIAEGLANRENPSWAGNGVCRNIAANVKAVFEALKATQGGLSMLNNTYASFDIGFDGQGYQERRRGPDDTRASGDGHAWNTFTTIDRNGSAAVTILDTTWALEPDVLHAVDHLDQTYARMATPMVELFRQSKHKERTFEDISYFLDMVASIAHDRGLDATERMDLSHYAVSEYIKAAASFPDIPAGHKMPRRLVEAAYRTREDLTKEEIKTLYRIYSVDPLSFDNNSSGSDTLDHILQGYDKGNMRRDPTTAANKMILPGDLQKKAAAAVGEKRLAELMQNSNFRMRMRFIR